MSAAQDTRKGIALMVATMLVFAMQDGLSRHLAGEYNVLMVVMVRYWFFALFVLAVAARAPGGLRAAVGPRRLGGQVGRGVLLAAGICGVGLAFVAAAVPEAIGMGHDPPNVVAMAEEADVVEVAREPGEALEGGALGAVADNEQPQVVVEHAQQVGGPDEILHALLRP